MQRCRFLLISALTIIGCTSSFCKVARAEDATFLDDIDDADTKRDLIERLIDLDMYDTNENKLAKNVTIQPFVDREASDDSVNMVRSSFLAVKWPSAPDYDIVYVVYLPDGASGTMHAVHVCGFLQPEFCENMEPYPGKTQGRCGISDESNQQETKFFCDFVTLTEVAEENNGAIVLSGVEDLQRLERHMEMSSDGEEQKYPPEIHFEVVELGDEGFDYEQDDLSAAPAPSPSTEDAAAPSSSSNRRLLIVRGPAFAGMQMTMRAGPGGRRGRNGRSSFVTLPGSLGG